LPRVSSQVSLTIQTKDKNLIYSATGLNDEHDLAVIKGMFAAFGLCEGGPLPELPPAVVAGTQQVAVTAIAEPPAKTQMPEPEKPKAQQEQSASRPRQLPFINAERGTTKIGDIPGVADKLIEAGFQIVEKTNAQVPDHIATGIKLKEIGGEIKRTYRCKNHCPKCGEISNSYLLPHNVWSKCFHCGTKLAAVPAIPGELLVPDEHMNFFYAEEEYYEVGYDDDRQGSESDPADV